MTVDIEASKQVLPEAALRTYRRGERHGSSTRVAERLVSCPLTYHEVFQAALVARRLLHAFPPKVEVFGDSENVQEKTCLIGR